MKRIFILSLSLLIVVSVTGLTEHCHEDNANEQAIGDYDDKYGNFVLVRDYDRDGVLEITSVIIQGVNLHRVEEDDEKCTLDSVGICLTANLNEYFFSPDGRSVIVENRGGITQLRKTG